MYKRHTTTAVTKGLLDNMVRFFLHDNFKAWHAESRYHFIAYQSPALY